MNKIVLSDRLLVLANEYNVMEWSVIASDKTSRKRAVVRKMILLAKELMGLQDKGAI